MKYLVPFIWLLLLRRYKTIVINEDVEIIYRDIITRRGRRGIHEKGIERINPSCREQTAERSAGRCGR